jgi:hypothetical protein
MLVIAAHYLLKNEAEKYSQPSIFADFLSANSLIHMKNDNSQSVNSRIMVQNSGTYLPRITRGNCTSKNWIVSDICNM